MCYQLFCHTRLQLLIGFWSRVLCIDPNELEAVLRARRKPFEFMNFWMIEWRLID